MQDIFYSRNLPHWHPAGAILFLTWRLHSSLPLINRTARNGCATNRDRPSAGKEFVRKDRELDLSKAGPTWLKDPRIAEAFIRALKKGSENLGYFELFAYVVMPNHVHVVLAPKIVLKRITNGLKGATARVANATLNRVGKPFWQDESYDHWIRDEREFARVCAYVECNPVGAGLAMKPEYWPWSSANRSPAIPGCALPTAKP